MKQRKELRILCHRDRGMWRINSKSRKDCGKEKKKIIINRLRIRLLKINRNKISNSRSGSLKTKLKKK
jgi:hypothetical protein